MSSRLNLDGYSKKVTTSSPDCQLWIDRGIIQMYGYNHEEAIRCFSKAISFDDCAMAHYFIAYSNACNYNNSMGLDYGAGFKEAEIAINIMKSSGSSSAWEIALIEAQRQRFCWPPDAKSIEEMNKEYAKAMRSVYEKFGKDDPDIAAFFAESLMALAPWKLWNPPPDCKPSIPETEELVMVLETALKAYPKHPGLCHFYIHTMELSATPEKAMPSADVLRDCGLNQGHLIHMPSHIDMWVGHYKEAVEVNMKAIIADDLYVKDSGVNNEFYKLYRVHNYHFVAWAAMFDGQYAAAMQCAEAAEKQIDPETVAFCVGGKLPLGSLYFESFASLPWHVLVRFGKWQEIIDRPLKEDKDMYAGTVATSHYARAVAFAVTGRIKEAEEEKKHFYKALNNKALVGRLSQHNNIVHDAEKHSGVLDVAEAVLNGELEYYKGNCQEAFKFLRLAVERDSNLLYDEPWGWMMPARHVLGALLVEQGEVVEAEAVYREDLKQYKDNLWSLLGLYQALKKQGKMEEAEVVQSAFQKASVNADIKIEASCLCATKICCE